MCFVWISEQTAIISLYSINWPVFIADKESVYCAVRAESLTRIQVNFHFKGLLIFFMTRVMSVFTLALTVFTSMSERKYKRTDS